MNSFSSLRVQGQNYTSKQQPPTARETILNFLRLVALDTSIASDFSQVWLVREFQLGDNLISYSLDQETEDTSNVFYLVCTGRVRLLGFDATVGRFVSTGLLLPQQTFGADHLFCNQPLPYRAIAASAGFVAQVSISDLMLWLQRLPNLQDYIHQVALERQGLIFFKTATELRLHKSHTLRQLLPYLVQTKISAGSSLVEATPANKGRFWLASGKIHSSISETQPPLVGESWGYPDVTLPDISAETDLLLYHLPIKHWDSATAIAPELFPPRYEEEDRGQGELLTAKPPILLFPQSQSPQDKGKHRLNSEKLPPQLPQLPHPPISPSNLSPISPSPNLPIPQNHQARPSRLTAWLWRRIPFIQQQSSSDCGAACLAMISRYWGKRFSLNMLRSLARTDRMGASLPALANAGEKLGYDALPVRASLSKLELQTNPWIAHWQGIHYVVVWQVKGSRVLISDPAIGKRSLSRQEFEANWTEYALLLSPTERLRTVKSEKISLGGIGQVFWHHRNLLVQIFFASVLLQVFGLATPLFTQVVLDQVMPDKNEVTLNVFAVAFLVFGIWRIGLTAVRQYLLDYFSNRMDATLIGSFISHALRLPLQFFASRQVGDIITRVQENRKIQMFLTRQAFCATLDALFAVFYLGLMAYYNLQLTLLVLGLILPIVILTVWASPFLKTVSREIFKRSAEQNSLMVEMMTGVATVKTTAAERPVRWRWEERFTNMVKVRFRGQKLANNLQLVNSLINHLGNTAVLWYGATLVIRGEMSVGQFVAFNMLIGNAINPILALVRQWDEFQEVVISMERLNDVLSAEPEENTQKPLLVLPPIRGDVHFENVTFRFNQDERNTLQNISFKVKAGQTIGIVGYSGSGKSTLVSLLAGLYHPNGGRILIDGHDIAHVSPHSLRSQLGVVPQDSFLFSGTLLENITLYSSEFTLEQAYSAAKLADAHAFIQELPLGYNTKVGEGGMMLSGGQRQRIAIARALVRKPRILILDEATSSLDAESEHRFQQNLAQFSRVSVTTPNQARTTFIIAHRLSTVRHADCILILDRGVLVEQGTHDELMTINGFYYQLAQQQLHL